MVHVHADKFVRQIASHISSELQRVLHCLGAMVEAVADAGRENSRNGFTRRWVKPFVNHVAAEGQGKAVILAPPPGAEVFAANQALVLIRELALVNDETDIRLAGADRLENPVERHDDAIQMRSAECEVRSSAF